MRSRHFLIARCMQAVIKEREPEFQKRGVLAYTGKAGKRGRRQAQHGLDRSDRGADVFRQERRTDSPAAPRGNWEAARANLQARNRSALHEERNRLALGARNCVGAGVDWERYSG